LFELEKRGKINEVNIKLVNEKELKDIEPNAIRYKHALYSPTTATVEPVEVCKC
jgi:L-2-hydroxyglutarate oxidase LhgO